MRWCWGGLSDDLRRHASEPGGESDDLGTVVPGRGTLGFLDFLGVWNLWFGFGFWSGLMYRWAGGFFLSFGNFEMRAFFSIEIFLNNVNTTDLLHSLPLLITIS